MDCFVDLFLDPRAEGRDVREELSHGCAHSFERAPPHFALSLSLFCKRLHDEHPSTRAILDQVEDVSRVLHNVLEPTARFFCRVSLKSWHILLVVSVFVRCQRNGRIPSHIISTCFSWAHDNTAEQKANCVTFTFHRSRPRRA